jgi:hypothetical protein
MSRTRGLFVALAAVASLALAPSAAGAQYHFYRGDHVRNRPAHIGLSGIGGAQVQTQEPGAPVDGFVSVGMDVLGTLVPGFALGFTRAGVGFGYSSAEDVIFTLTITPTIELSFFPSSDVQLFLQLGATVGFHNATRVARERGDAAVTSAIGARFWLGNTLTFGVLVGSDIGVTNAGIRRWIGGPLGVAEVSFFGGLELGWNL